MKIKKRILYSLMFMLFVFIALYFVSAEYIIRTYQGYNNFSFNEGVSSRYNISINNSYTGLDSNITQVNITLPDGFVFSFNTSGTNSYGEFSNTTNTLTWSNDSGIVLSNSTNYFWFNISSPLNTNGTYDLTVLMLTPLGRNVSNVSFMIRDKTAPSFLSLSRSRDSESITLTWTTDEPVTYVLKFGDDASLDLDDVCDDYEDTNLKTSDTVVCDGLEADTPYRYNLTITDAHGNNYTEEEDSYSTEEADDESSSSSGTTTTGFWSQTFFENDELRSIDEIEISLARTERVRIKVNGDRFYLGIVALSSSSATINITDGDDIKLQTKFSEGDTQKYELDGDNYYDLLVELIDIKNNKAEIKMTYLRELKTSSNNSAGPNFVNNTNSSLQENGNQSGGQESFLGGVIGSISSPWKVVLYIFIASIILLIIGFIINRLTRKNKNNKKSEEDKLVNKVKHEIKGKTAKQFMKDKVNVKSP